jgi:hypothetical protein
VAKVLALAAADGENSVVIICGTGYIMPDARAELGLIEPRFVVAFIYNPIACRSFLYRV